MKEAARGRIAAASIVFEATSTRVWDGLRDPEKIKRYVLGADAWRKCEHIPRAIRTMMLNGLRLLLES